MPDSLSLPPAVVFFDEQRAYEFEMRRKRGGHLLSKGHVLGAQFCAYLENENWLKWARHANAMMAAIYDGLKGLDYVSFDFVPEGNIAFINFPRRLHQKLFDAGAQFYLFPAYASLQGAGEEMLRARLVTSWATRGEDVTEFIKILQNGD